MPTRIDDLIHTSMKQMNSQQLSLIKKQTQISTWTLNWTGHLKVQCVRFYIYIEDSPVITDSLL